jgi:hypothetical protein
VNEDGRAVLGEDLSRTEEEPSEQCQGSGAHDFTVRDPLSGWRTPPR